MEKETYKCIDFFNKYVVEFFYYKETDDVIEDDDEKVHLYKKVSLFRKSRLAEKFSETDMISINRPSFNENIKYVREKEEKIIKDDIFKWLDVRINGTLAVSLLDEWSTKDINEFAQVIKSFLLDREILSENFNNND